MADRGFEEAMRAMQQKSLHEKMTKYRMLNRFAKKGQTVFAGSSLMEFFPIEEMQLAEPSDTILYNRGLAGATTADYLEAMEVCLFELEPSRIFINIGSNDIGSVGPGGYASDKLLANYGVILERIRNRLPACAVFVMAYYPVNPSADFGLDQNQRAAMFATRTNENIGRANDAVEGLAKAHGVHFINVNDGLSDADGCLKKEYSIDGIHLWPNAYRVIWENLRNWR